MESNTILIIVYFVMSFITAGMAFEHSQLAIIPFIIAVVLGIVLYIQTKLTLLY